MKPLLSPAITKYVESSTSQVSPLLEELERETYEKMQYPEMLIGREEGLLLQMLIRLSGAVSVLELGTFTGYSALMMAEGLPEGGTLVTCEVSGESAGFAQRYFDKSPHGHKIRLRTGPAIATMRTIADESMDFIFIDADKVSYVLYYEESMRILKPGGVIAADNTLWSGKVLEPEDDESRAIALFNETVNNDDRVENVILTVRDGVSLIRKKTS